MYINVIYLLHKYILGFYLVIQKAKQLRLALNGNTPNQIEKILFLIMNFRFSCLSWISSTLTEFRQMNSVPKASICSLSDKNAVRKFALLGLFRFNLFFYYPPFPLVRDTQSRPRQSHPEQKLEGYFLVKITSCQVLI